MKKVAAVIVVVLLAAIGAVAWLSRPQPQTSGGELMVYCAAGLKQPVEQIAQRYQEETGTTIKLQYGGTGTLLSSIRVADRGDLFISADNAGITDAKKYDLIRETLPLIRQRPVVAVKSGNPLHIQSYEDLFRPEVRLASANPEAAAIGRTVKKALGDRYAKLAAKITVLKPTVTEIASDVQIGAADAAIVWDSTVPQFKGTQAVDLPEFSGISENAAAAVLAHSQQATAALKFARYLAAPEKGGAIFKQHGFDPVGGDRWAATPEFILYSGSVNRVALEPILRAFADREGIKLTTVYNGCGILCAAMKSMQDNNDAKFPDAYYACDLCFVPPVARQFPQTLVLTETEIGIVVPKGNPKQVHSPADLSRAGLRVGLCNAEQSTLGYMTAGILQSSGIEAVVRKNAAVEAPTADFLINQMRAGALDAAIVYRVNAQLQPAHLDFIKIDHPGALARQPFSIRKDSDNHFLAARLLEHLKSRRSDFEKAGFVWRGDGEMVRSDTIDIPQWLRSGWGKSR